MAQIDWDRYFFDIVKVAKSKSKDRSTKVGAVVVGPDKAIRATGFNGFPRGVDDDIEKRHERPVKYLFTEHAERNALFAAAKTGIALEGCTIYLEWYPCADCARAIIQSGLVEVVIDGDHYKENEAYWTERWSESCNVGLEMLSEASVKIRISGRESQDENGFNQEENFHPC